MTSTDRYRQVLEQHAYRRRVRAFGLPALLALHTAGRAYACPGAVTVSP